MLCSGHKSDIPSCIGAPTSKSPAAQDVSMMVFNGPAIVHMVKPTIVSFLQGQISAAANNIDVVWDVYPDESLKA